MEQHSADCKGNTQQVSHQHHKGKTATHSHYAYISSCLVSNPYAIILTIMLTDVSSSQHKIAFTIKNSTRKNWGLVPGLVYHIQDTPWLPTMEAQDTL